MDVSVPVFIVVLADRVRSEVGSVCGDSCAVTTVPGAAQRPTGVEGTRSITAAINTRTRALIPHSTVRVDASASRNSTYCLPERRYEPHVLFIE